MWSLSGLLQLMSVYVGLLAAPPYLAEINELIYFENKLL